jgi:hypothetical protein
MQDYLSKLFVVEIPLINFIDMLANVACVTAFLTTKPPEATFKDEDSKLHQINHNCRA